MHKTEGMTLDELVEYVANGGTLPKEPLHDVMRRVEQAFCDMAPEKLAKDFNKHCAGVEGVFQSVHSEISDAGEDQFKERTGRLLSKVAVIEKIMHMLFYKGCDDARGVH